MDTPTPLLDTDGPTRGTVTARIVTGGDPTPVDLASSAVGSAVFSPDHAHTVIDIAVGPSDVVLLVANCTGDEPGRAVRIDSDGKTGTIPRPKQARRVSLVHGGDRVWVATSPSSFGYGPVTLLAADGSGVTRTLPDGLEPIGARGHQVIAQYTAGGMPIGRFAVYDVKTRDVVLRFGTVPATGGVGGPGGATGQPTATTGSSATGETSSVTGESKSATGETSGATSKIAATGHSTHTTESAAATGSTGPGESTAPTTSNTTSGSSTAGESTATDTDPTAGAVNAILDGEYLVTAPWVCGTSCAVRRYDVRDGTEDHVALDPPVDRLLAGGGTVSPDGSEVAIPLFFQPPAPAPFDPNWRPSTGRDGTTRIGLLGLDTGTVRALPGLTLGPFDVPAMAFSPDGKWLIVAVSAGDQTRVVVYDDVGNGPHDPNVRVPGNTLFPALAVTGEP